MILAASLPYQGVPYSRQVCNQFVCNAINASGIMPDVVVYITTATLPTSPLFAHVSQPQPVQLRLACTLLVGLCLASCASGSLNNRSRGIASLDIESADLLASASWKTSGATFFGVAVGMTSATVLGSLQQRGLTALSNRSGMLFAPCDGEHRGRLQGFPQRATMQPGPIGRLIALALLLVSWAGCRDAAVIWSAESRSPDGRHIASAQTVQFAGPGTASVETTVYLRESSERKPGTAVLSLDNDSAYPAGVTNVGMSWRGPAHLVLDYHGHASIALQAIRCYGIEITLMPSPQPPDGAKNQTNAPHQLE